MLWIVCLAPLVQSVISQRFIQIVNRNKFPIFVQIQPNDGQPSLEMGAMRQVVSGYPIKYDIPKEGWAGRLWPKTGCDRTGYNCEFGQSIEPCLPNGCQPPANTKVEFNFPPENSQNASSYDINLVDGYSLASEIVPCDKDGKPYQDELCISTNCQMTLDQCPKDERNDLGDLSAKGSNDNTVGCLSPCEKWIAPEPWGLAHNEQEGNGRTMCCPADVSSDDCRNGPVVETNYVKLVRDKCKKAYSFSYDDKAGLHNCPSITSFIINFYS